jgi:ATP-dependent Clp protease adaptor protein ClpS
MSDPEGDSGTGTLEKSRSQTKRPQFYRVILHNDDYTTQEFVVEILESIFNKSPAEAHRIMMQVHTQGKGTCGSYTHEVAETKVVTVHDEAKDRGFPLRASMEEA